MYQIYEISGVKIGCTREDQFKTRQHRQKDKGQMIILEEHTCIYEASKRERELQAEKGYPIDSKPYYVTAKMVTAESGRKGGLNGSLEDKAKAGRIGGRIGGKTAGKIIGNRKTSCPYCGLEGNPGAIATHIKFKH